MRLPPSSCLHGRDLAVELIDFLLVLFDRRPQSDCGLGILLRPFGLRQVDNQFLLLLQRRNSFDVGRGGKLLVDGVQLHRERGLTLRIHELPGSIDGDPAHRHFLLEREDLLVGRFHQVRGLLAGEERIQLLKLRRHHL